MEKILASLSLMSILMLGTSVSASADVIGGWSEEDGNFRTSKIETFASSPTHSGKVEEQKPIPPTSVQRRAVGNTTWKDKYHYTRAQMNNRFTGTVYTDSGRKWGTGKTSATSAWYTDNYEVRLSTGKTFYGS